MNSADRSTESFHAMEMILTPQTSNITVSLTLHSIDTHFGASTTAFENTVGKEEIAYSSFPTMFSTQSDNHIPICPYF